MKSEHVFLLVGALLVGAFAQHVARQEAVALGLSSIELAALGFAIGAFTKRAVT